MLVNKELSSGVIVTWAEIKKTETDYFEKITKVTTYYWLDEQARLDGKEPAFAEVVETPFVEEETLKEQNTTTLEEAYTNLEQTETPVEVIEEPTIPLTPADEVI